MTTKTIKRFSVPVLALLLAVFTGYVNLTASEIQPPMLCMLVGAGLLGFLQPKAAWRWGILMGVSVPLSYFFALMINLKLDGIPHNPITLIVLIIPGLIAAYAGALLSKTMRTAELQS